MAKTRVRRSSGVTVFVSWSEERSKQVAIVLKRYIKFFFRNISILSSSDMGAGASWVPELQRLLARSSFGIICMTPENLESSWLHYEAGALSKMLGDTTCVVPYRFGVKAANVKWPLAQFQAVDADRDGTLSLLMSINTVSRAPLEAEEIRDLFGQLWERMESELKSIPPYTQHIAPPREQTEIIEEILETTRRTSARLENLEHLVSSLTGLMANLDHIVSSLNDLVTTRMTFEDPLTKRTSEDTDIWNHESVSWTVLLIRLKKIIAFNRDVAISIFSELENGRIPARYLKLDWGQSISDAERLLPPEGSRLISDVYQICCDASARLKEAAKYVDQYTAEGLNGQKDGLTEAVFRKYMNDVDPLDGYFTKTVIPELKRAVDILQVGEWDKAGGRKSWNSNDSGDRGATGYKPWQDDDGDPIP